MNSTIVQFGMRRARLHLQLEISSPCTEYIEYTPSRKVYLGQILHPRKINCSRRAFSVSLESFLPTNFFHICIFLAYMRVCTQSMEWSSSWIGVVRCDMFGRLIVCCIVCLLENRCVPENGIHTAASTFLLLLLLLLLILLWKIRI